LISKESRINAAHVAWTALICSIFIWGLGEVRPGELGNTGNWYRIVLVLFAAIGGMFALLRNIHRLSQAFPGPLLLFLLYGLFAMISSAYIPRHSVYSMWKGFEVVTDVIVVAAMLSYAEAQASARMAYRIIVIVFIALMGIYWIEALLMPSAAFFPSRGIVPFAMQGVLPVMNGNALAFLSAVVAYAALCGFLNSTALSRQVLSLCVLAWALITLLLSQSRTSLIGLVVAICVYFIFDRRWVLLAVIATGSAIAAALTPLADVAEQYLIRGQSQQLFTSLSGRTHGWTAAWALFQQSPLIGHGFAAAARVEILGTAGASASTLHGAIFDVMVGVGLLGLIPWIAAILWTSLRLLSLAARAGRRRNQDLDRSHLAQMLGLLALILVRSSTSSGLAMHDHTLMLFLAVLAYVSAASRRASRDRAATPNRPQSVTSQGDVTPHAAV
jgi:O-antigen ligase